MLKMNAEWYEACSYTESGSTRLTGFNSSYVGFVQVCREEYWATISYKDEGKWTRKNSMVVCRELGFHGTTRIFSQTGYKNTSANLVMAGSCMYNVLIEICIHHSIQLHGDPYNVPCNTKLQPIIKFPPGTQAIHVEQFQ